MWMMPSSDLGRDGPEIEAVGFDTVVVMSMGYGPPKVRFFNPLAFGAHGNYNVNSLQVRRREIQAGRLRLGDWLHQLRHS
jgi:hypothetical protein